MMERFVALLRAADLDPTPLEIADSLWLAEHLSGSDARSEESLKHSPSVPSSPSRFEDGAPPDAASPGPSERVAQDRAAEMFLEGSAGIEGNRLAFRSPDATALPNALRIGRALRPLKRRVPSRVRVELDEAATAERISEGRRPAIVLRPAPTRWLDVALVVDDTSSMAIWRPTLGSLRSLLAHHGAFRDVRPYTFTVDDEGLQLFSGTPGGDRRAVRPKELLECHGHRLVLVATDGVASAWADGRLGAALSVWATRCPVAIVQVLPERLWRRCTLGSLESVRVRAATPGARNTDLNVESMTWDSFSADGPRDAVPMPVVELEAMSLSSWAALVSGSGMACAEGRMLPLALPDGRRAQAPVSSSSAPKVGAAERVRRFYSLATPKARELAALYAAAPLSLPVMRLVRETMLPDATIGHQAEIFLGGLLRENAAEADRADPNYVRYDFHEGVRDLLLDAASAGRATEVLTRVSEYVTEHLGSSVDFRVWLGAPSALGGQRIRDRDAPFARIGAAVLQRLGGQYAALGDALRSALVQTDAPRHAADGAADGAPALAAAREVAASRPDNLAMLELQARRYDALRTTPSGNERTQAMNRLVEEVTEGFVLPDETLPPLEEIFWRGGGYRVLVLALLEKHPDPNAFGLVMDGIAKPRSAFEQYTAIRAAWTLLPALEVAQRENLRRALVYQRSDKPGAWITLDDRSRWDASRALLDAIAERTFNAAAPLTIFDTAKQETKIVWSDGTWQIQLYDKDLRRSHLYSIVGTGFRIRTGPKADPNGTLDIGNRRRWLYSKHLFTSPAELADALRERGFDPFVALTEPASLTRDRVGAAASATTDEGWGAVHHGYAERMAKETGYLVAWPPAQAIRLGDVGILESGAFRGITTLSEMDVAFRIETSSQPFDSDMRFAVDFQEDQSGAVVTCRLRNGESFLFNARRCRESIIDDREALNAALSTRLKEGTWDPRWIVVDTVIAADACTALFCFSGEATVQLRGPLTGAAGKGRLDADAEVEIATLRGHVLSLIGARRLTPLFRASTVRRRRIGGPRLETLPR